MNDYLKSHPFDLYELSLIHQVASLQSFTKTAAIAGITQSAITRQIQGVEARLGIELFIRTTRKVKLSPAGNQLIQETESIFQKILNTLTSLKENNLNQPKTIRIGISPGIGLCIFPGFFARYIRSHPNYQIQLEIHDDERLLKNLELEKIDFAVFSPPPKISPHLKIYKSFVDPFVLITPKKFPLQSRLSQKIKSLSQMNWLLWDERDYTGKTMRLWLKKEGIIPISHITMPQPDLTIQLVIMGYGVALVPNRLLSLYRSRRSFNTYPLWKPFQRKIMIVGRREKRVPLHSTQFLESVLFSDKIM